MKNIGIGVILGSILIVGAAFLGYKFYPDDKQAATSADNVDVVVNAVTQAPDSDEDSPGDNKVEVIDDKGQYIDTDALNPTACLRFSDALDPEKQPQYSDFINVSPKTSLSARVNARALCLSGFDFGKDYQITVKTGLPALQAEPLARDEAVAISFGARPPFVGFAGNGIILPRKDAQGLAFETVNVSKLTATIYKVNDRMLARRVPSEGHLTGEGEYGWEYEDAATSIRSKLWSGEIDVNSIPNQRVTTVLPISELVGDLKDGAYVVSIARGSEGDNIRRPARAWRWIIVTDLAVTTYSGDHGLTVFTRSLKTAQRQAGAEVHLLAKNNAILGKAVTDATGKVEFPAPLLAGKGADSPRMLLAYGTEGDFAMIDLRRSPLDLSDYDIAGRKKGAPIDGYGFADRGIFRPGETSHLTFMLRTGDVQAADARAATLKVMRPDNIAAFEARVSGDDFKAGTYYTAFDIPKEAPRGSWTATLLPDGQTSPVSIQFDVQDFVPQKLRVAFKEATATYDGSGELRLPLQADFLYGAPAADLSADGEARLEIDPKPFPDFKDYSFAPRDPDFTGSLHYLNGGATDENGAIDLVLENLPQIKASNLPLRLQITGGVAEPSGRYVRDSLFVPARSQDRYAGIRSDYKRPAFKKTVI